MSMVTLPEDEFRNFHFWKAEDEKIRNEESRRQNERISGVFKQYPVQNNPYLNELLKSAFRRVKKLNMVGTTTFVLGDTISMESYNHKNEVGGNIYG